MLDDNLILGYTSTGAEIKYSDFKKNIYIIRSIVKLTPDGVKAVIKAREIDPFVDGTVDTLMALKGESVCH
jgi:hypothetical protein